MTKQAVIIGAGPAGLTAAYELLRTTSIHPPDLESDTQVGGLSRTVDFSGNRMDIGGHRFFTKNTRVQALWDQLMPHASAPALDDRLLHRPCTLVPQGADPEQADRVFLDRQRVSRILYRHRFFDYPVSLNRTTIRNLGLGTMAEIGCSYLASCLHKRPEHTLEDFMVNRFGEKLYQTFFAGYTEKVWGRSPKNLSADWGSQRIKGISIGAVLKDLFQRTFHIQPKSVQTSLIERFAYPKLGPGQFYETLRDEVIRLGGEIRMGATVTGFTSGPGKTLSAVQYRDQQGNLHQVPGDIVLSTMPVKDLAAGLPQDWLSPKARETAATLPYRDFMTAGLLVDRLELKNETDHPTLNHIVPDCWIYVQEPEVKLGRLQIFNNWSPYLVRDPLHTLWIGLEYFCQEGDALWSMTDEAFLAFAAKELETIQVIRPGAVQEGHVVRMKKAYPAYYGSYRDFPRLRQELDTIPNLYCMGRNGQHRYNNMDHSMLSALTAVDLIRQGETDKTALWQVNTEQEYQETETQGGQNHEK
jgi:protoporphyrinogen oxidase